MNLIAPGLGTALGFVGLQDGGLANRGLAVVGEAGPELVDFRQPGRVYTNEELQNALQGNRGTTVNFAPVIYSSDGAAVRKALEDSYPLLEQSIINTMTNQLSSPTQTRQFIRA